MIYRILLFHQIGHCQSRTPSTSGGAGAVLAAMPGYQELPVEGGICHGFHQHVLSTRSFSSNHPNSNQSLKSPLDYLLYTYSPATLPHSRLVDLHLRTLMPDSYLPSCSPSTCYMLPWTEVPQLIRVLHQPAKGRKIHELSVTICNLSPNYS